MKKSSGCHAGRVYSFSESRRRKSMEILKIENLTKVYGKGENEVHALNGVSFSVEKGEFVSIIGSSGSGKSTLLHLIGGCLLYTSDAADEL